MRYSEKERQILLSVKGVGPTVIQRFEELAYHDLSRLALADALEIVTLVSENLGSTCWKNSPQARAAVQGAITAAKNYSKSC